MILAINTNGKINSIAIYQNKKIEKVKTWCVDKNNRKDLLVEIEMFLKQNKVTLNNLNKIGIFQGPGSLTSVRVGITIANTLAWFLNIPVIGVKTKNYNDNIDALKIAKIIEKRKLSSKAFSKVIIPHYNSSIK